MSRRVLSVFGIDPFRIGSNEAFARELSRQLSRHGWESILCFLAEPPDAVCHFLQAPNVSFEVLERPWEINWNAARGLLRVLRRWRPEIVHSHFTGLVSLCPWLSRLAGVKKTFFTDHASHEEAYIPRRAPGWKRVAVRGINWPLSGAVSVSEYGCRCLKTLDLLPAEKLRRIYNGVDLPLVERSGSAVSFRRKYGIPEGRSLVVQVSWIRPEKGLGAMLEAVRRVIAVEPEVHFAIAGEGDFRAQYMRQTREMGLADHVTWTGLIENPFAEGVYAAADIVCQPSRWEEVFGWVIAEAMAFGKPVVATRVGGIPELVEDGVNGFLTDRGDNSALSGKILLLLKDPALRERMGRAGRFKAEQDFDLRNNVGRLLDWYGIQ